MITHEPDVSAEIFRPAYVTSIFAASSFENSVAEEGIVCILAVKLLANYLM